MLIYSLHGPHGQNRGQRKLTRQRKDIFPDYEKRVQERVLGDLDDEEEENTGHDNDGENLENTDDNTNTVKIIIHVYHLLDPKSSLSLKIRSCVLGMWKIVPPHLPQSSHRRGEEALSHPHTAIIFNPCKVTNIEDLDLNGFMMSVPANQRPYPPKYHTSIPYHYAGHTPVTGSGSDSDLGSHFSRRGLRATVCNAELNKARKW